MKRHNLTAIIKKTTDLTIQADRYTTELLNGLPAIVNVPRYVRYRLAINKAAVNEIIRLEADNTVDWQEFLTGQLKTVQP